MLPPKLGIIAGSGNLPLELAKHARSESRDVFVLGIDGFAEKTLLDQFENQVVSIGEVGKQISILQSAKVVEVCFAGIVKRPDFKALKLDKKGLLLLPKVISAASKGDDALLKVLVATLEKAGFAVVGADDVLASLLAPVGPLGSKIPNEQDLKDIEKAARIASQIGQMDIGQGAVVCEGLVLAVEAQEGTDLMLERCAKLPSNLLGTPQKPKGVLVKRPKPNQERRVDLPTIGLKTLQGIRNANLAGIAIEAKSALILDREQLISYADANGLWIYGFQDDFK